MTYCVPDEGIPFVSVAWPGLSGSVTGMNKQRLALFINAGATRDFRRIGTPTIILARQVLQHARDIEEALAIIRSTTVFVSDILVLADGKSGQAVVVEKSPATTAVWPVSESAVVANHFVFVLLMEHADDLGKKEGEIYQAFLKAAIEKYGKTSGTKSTSIP